ncbi:response regulator [Roseivirga misakiensis]|uniref:Response regulatory domain-containing protein n=1 Tax=Roseivirga misakiensis TaxID=1563681 RepID=A0A1E5SYZ1_9BACT|nr:response regulator [Roseivirga misakiensis]OEK04331.1 hypothetical protein BFP71_12675 [Roseivirga misakiensis]
MSPITNSLLIIEDELTTRRLLTYLLEPYYFVHCVEDGMKAKAWLTAGNRPDLIITDIEMPMMNGLELIDLLKSKSRLRSIPVIVMSSLNEKSAKAQKVISGVGVFLQKPIEPKVLFWRIEQMLAQTVIL